MKKNRLMRLACLLIVLTLMTSCFVGGTFAKYTTTVDASDTARVAAWGFGDTSTIDFELFSTEYDGTVESEDGTTRVIAPGTTQTEMVTLNYADTTGLGAPEVDYTIDLNVVADAIGASIEANTNIVWSFNGTTYDHSGGTSSWDKMIAAIEAYHEDVAANNAPVIQSTGIEIKWDWAFGSSDAEHAVDTAMGNAATLETVILSIKLVAEQVN